MSSGPWKYPPHKRQRSPFPGVLALTFGLIVAIIVATVLIPRII